MRFRTIQLLATLSLLIAWVATPLLSVAHLALEEHRYCAEHERLEESNSHTLESTAANDSEQQSVVRRSSLPSDERPSHEACAFSPELIPVGNTLAGFIAIAIPDAGFEISSICPSLRFVHCKRLFDEAPKTSPPFSV